MSRTIKPKMYCVAVTGGQVFHVRALSAPAAKKAVIDRLSGPWLVRALDDDAVFALARSGGEVLDAITPAAAGAVPAQED